MTLIVLFYLDFETIIALLDQLFAYGQTSLKFLGTIERRRYIDLFVSISLR